MLRLARLTVLAWTTVGLNQLPQQVQSSSSSQNMTLAQDEQFTNHSGYASTDSCGQAGQCYKFTAATPFLGYNNGQMWLMIPNAPCLANATINVNGLGPLAMYTQSSLGAAPTPIAAGGCVANNVPVELIVMTRNGGSPDSVLVK